jgi:hypothetical protein
VTYHGGAVLPHVEAEAVFLGSSWRSDLSLSGVPGLLGGFLQSLVGGSYMDQLSRAGYGVGRGIYTGAVIDPAPPGLVRQRLPDSE